jgi:ketosteroid isomerase-like protein
MMDHPYLDTIRTYYEGCSTGDVALMRSALKSDVIHYFTAHRPVRGAEALADFWQRFNSGDRRTVWTADHGLASGDEAVIEWTMVTTYLDGRPREVLRGAEWVRFREDKIAEIRAYYLWTPEQRESELIGFPYAERGYPAHEAE